MKKEKIMLTVIAVLAILSGVLAVKAKKFTQDYCTTTVIPGHVLGWCRQPLTQGMFRSTVPKVYYTITAHASQCQQENLYCQGSTSLGEE